VRLYLQKPDVCAQNEAGAIGLDGRTVLDAGVMSFDGSAAARLLRAFRTPPAREAILSHGIDLYREVCCALGTEATLAHYVKTARGSGSTLDEALLASLFAELHQIPLHVQILDGCGFLHFGSTSQLISSGLELVAQDQGAPPATTILAIDDDVQANGGIDGREVWVEGCRLRAPLGLRAATWWLVSMFSIRSSCRKEPAWTSHRAWIERAARYVSSGAAAWMTRSSARWRKALRSAESRWRNGCWRPAHRSPASGTTIHPKRSARFGTPGCFRPSESTELSGSALDVRRGQCHAGAEACVSFADRYSSAEIAVRADHATFYARRAALRAAAK